MAPKMGFNPPSNTPNELVGEDTYFERRASSIEMQDPYHGSNLPVTPVSSTDDSSIKDPSHDISITESRDHFKSECTQELKTQNWSTEARLESLEYGANWFSRLIFNWISGLLWVSLAFSRSISMSIGLTPRFVLRLQTGYRRPLLSNDIPLIHPSRRAKGLAETAQDAFKANCIRGDKFALFWALYGVFKKEFLIGGVCRGLADILLVVTPYSLRYLIQFVMDSWAAGHAHRDGPPVWHGIAFLAGIITMLTIQTFAHNHYMYLLGVIGGQSRAVLTSVIFDKSMRVMGRGRAAAMEDQASVSDAPNKADKEEEKEDWSSGQLTGLLSVDCARISQTTSGLHMLWTAPFSIIVAISLCKVTHQLVLGDLADNRQ